MRFFVLVCLLMAATSSVADVAPSPFLTPEIRKECGSCHPAFPPEAMSKRQWIAVLNGLKDHFGEDATVPRAVLLRIGETLVNHAGPDVGDPAHAGMSKGEWWRSRHKSVIGNTLYVRTGISMDNCIACHTLTGF